MPTKLELFPKPTTDRRGSIENVYLALATPDKPLDQGSRRVGYLGVGDWISYPYYQAMTGAR